MGEQPEGETSSGFRAPNFIPEEPKLWFIQLECQFENANITNDNTKYNHVVAELDKKTLKKVKDILKNPPQQNKYDFLKTEIIKRTTRSDESNLLRFIKYEKLGDKKPSELLRKLSDLAGEDASEKLVRTAWLSRLPETIKLPLMQPSQKNLQEAAEAADLMYEVYSECELYSVKRPDDSAKILQELKELRKSVQELSAEVAKINRDNARLTPLPIMDVMGI